MLIRSGDTVVGVSGTTLDGTVHEFRGTAVVMATGGFAGNADMVREHAPALAGLEHLRLSNARPAHQDLVGDDARTQQVLATWQTDALLHRLRRS